MIESIPYVLTGIGIIISLLYYTSVLKNANKTQQMQLETRQAQLFINWFNKISSLEGIEQIRILRATEWSDHKEWLDMYQKDADYQRAFSWFLTAQEGVGVLIREGLVDIRLVALFVAGPSLELWNNYEEIILKERERRYGRLASEWEYTINELTKYIEEHPELAP